MAKEYHSNNLDKLINCGRVRNMRFDFEQAVYYAEKLQSLKVSDFIIIDTYRNYFENNKLYAKVIALYVDKFDTEWEHRFDIEYTKIEESENILDF